MVKHTVMFKLRGTPEERARISAEFAAALKTLPVQIPCLREIEVGLNQNPQESWDIVLTAILPDMASVEEYANHPAHVAAAAIVGPWKEDRACVDYEHDV